MRKVRKYGSTKKAICAIGSDVGVPADVTGGLGDRNSAHYLVLDSCLNRIMSEDKFKYIDYATPLGFGEGATLAPFDATAFNTALSGVSKYYRCSGNFFWASRNSCQVGAPYLVQ